MAIKKTIGGDRLGSGNKMKAALHNYERSTHDLGNVWRSSMAPGLLVPFYKKICTNGDTWTIDLTTLVKTMPATGPCFGSYKLQLDFFEIPIRLYNGILHNNMTKIGMDMAKVKLPTLTIEHKFKHGDYTSGDLSSDCLMAYLGIRGLGTWEGENDQVLSRTFNAVPMLAYYDIFKQYYSNKQEEKAFVITPQRVFDHSAETTKVTYNSIYNTTRSIKNYNCTNTPYNNGSSAISTEFMPYIANAPWNNQNYTNLQEMKSMVVEYENNTLLNAGTAITIKSINGKSYSTANPNELGFSISQMDANSVLIQLNRNTLNAALTTMEWTADEQQNVYLGIFGLYTINITKDTIKMQSFDLDNIDQARIEILSETKLGTTFDCCNGLDMLPYRANWSKNTLDETDNKQHLVGLVAKTYQSDIFNNWLSSKWIDGVKGINEISAVAVEDGKFTIDALNLAHKVYNMLNRIAMSGGTYEDWQEAVYGEQALRRAESPIYCGGMSGIITFEEVVSTADTDTANAGDQPLGTLGGKGILTNVKGGKIDIHIKEPAYIMGIASITPLIDYSQGNDFDMTEIESLNDLHKPELDEIGFQDLMLETAAHFTTWAEEDEGGNIVWHKQAGGKQPAWVQYMTSYNQVYGDFADNAELGFMVLNRKYEAGWGSDNNSETIEGGDAARSVLIKDWTTYVNPTKYNYQFANSKLEAQNFWVQIGINAIVRRKISAKLIPNL